MTASPTSNSALIEHSFFFTMAERERVTSTPVTITHSLIGSALRPLWVALDRLIPEMVSPNSIALFGVVLSMQALQVLTMYYKTQRDTATAVASVLLLVSTACGALDGVHASRCRSATFMGRIFSEMCHCVKHVFLALSVLVILGVEDYEQRWYTVMFLQLSRLAHMFVKYGGREGSKRVKVSNLFSSTEMTVLQIAIIFFPQYTPSTVITHAISEYAAYAYWTAVVACMITAPLMRSEGTSLVPLVISLAARMLPSFILPLNDLSHLSIIADAVVVATLSIEVCVSSLAHRSIHTAVSVIAVFASFNAVLAVSSCLLYLAGILLDLSVATKTPLFVPIRNVYIDGVFDLCHVGHKRLMERALTHGNRLVVGVMSDEATAGYKRKPVMNCDERCAEVRSCKYVSQVIPGAPCDGLTEEFIRKYNIHVVCYGEEYNTPTDKYYKVAREMGIGVTAPRTAGMSTSEIIRRIMASDAEALAAKDKADPNKKAV